MNTQINSILLALFITAAILAAIILLGPTLADCLGAEGAFPSLCGAGLGAVMLVVAVRR